MLRKHQITQIFLGSLLVIGCNKHSELEQHAEVGSPGKAETKEQLLHNSSNKSAPPSIEVSTPSQGVTATRMNSFSKEKFITQQTALLSINADAHSLKAPEKLKDFLEFGVNALREAVNTFWDEHQPAQSNNGLYSSSFTNKVGNATFDYTLVNREDFQEVQVRNLDDRSLRYAIQFFPTGKIKGVLRNQNESLTFYESGKPEMFSVISSDGSTYRIFWDESGKATEMKLKKQQ